MNDIQTLTVNSIRTLSADAIEKAKSGHPGIVLGSAPIGYTIFSNMVFNPKNVNFFNRDRFVLSAGHASMLLYSLEHLFGYKVSMDDIKNFRQLGSITTGHPEWKVCPGVETSTGPLGQGIANAVGMALAETYLAEKFNKEGFPIVDHYTYALCGDGCMQEGMENEAASLAGNLKLGKLIVFYDDNDITIEGNTDITFTEDVGKRHEALGWQVIKVADANDVGALNRAIKKAKAEKEKPSLIIVKSVIGYGSPLAGKESCHGAPLGEENIKLLKENLGWNYPPFTVPEEVYKHCKRFANKGKKAEKIWKETFAEYEKAYPDLAKDFNSFISGKLPDLENNEELFKYEKVDATRGYGGVVLNKLADLIPNLIGGSADLAPTNKTGLKGKGDFSANNRGGRNIHFGIREHAMSAVANGIYLHGGLRPFCSTFAVFSDYMKGGMRMSAIMGIPMLYVLTHDSIGVGEDGPTHEPVEQMAGLRAMPNIKVYRPADGVETTASYISALKDNEPSCMFLSRQTLPEVKGTSKDAFRGGYIVYDSNRKPEVIIMSSGSELAPTMEAKDILEKEGVACRVVSMPCMELFDKQPQKYKDSVLLKSVKTRLAVEAGVSTCWHKYVGLDGKIIGMDRFGESAPAKQLFSKFGFTAENIANTVKKMLNK